MKYKEKCVLFFVSRHHQMLTIRGRFNAMRQRYEQVTAVSIRPPFHVDQTLRRPSKRHEDYQRQLETANGKMKKLQAENECVRSISIHPLLI